MALTPVGHTGKQITEVDAYSDGVETAYIAADVVVTDAYVAADVVVTDAYIAADAVVETNYVAADIGAIAAAAVAAEADLDAHFAGPPTDGAMSVVQLDGLDMLATNLVRTDQTKDCHTTGAAAFDLANDVPTDVVLVSVQIFLQDAITAAGGCTKIGIGIVTDPDKYGKTTGVAASATINTSVPWAVLVGAADIQLYAVDNNGDAAGTMGGGAVGSERIKVRLVYATLTSLS
jgi:hypothetical protein